MKKSYRVLALQKRLLALVLSVAFLFCALIGRLFYLTLIEGSSLTSLAADQWTRDLPLKASRGDILDSAGTVLATDFTSYSLYARPRSVTEPDALAELLARELNEDVGEMREKLGKRVSEVTLARRVSKEQAGRILTSGYSGLYYSEDKTRSYPYGDMLCSVLGFTDSDGAGQAGLESYCDKYLRGTDGRALTQTDLRGIELTGEERLYQPSIPGLDLTLTVDKEIQSYAESAVKDAMEKYGAQSASMLIMDCTNGGVTAMASAPSFDLNAPPRNEISLLNLLAKNVMVTDVYEPGSTFKIFTLAAALSEGLTKEDDRFFCPGYRIVDGDRIRCWRTKGHGSQTLLEGVNNSCNCVFMDLAGRLGVEKLYDYLEAFGFGEKTGVDFAGESRGIVMNEKSVKLVDLVRIGFGQAIAVTPLQMVAATCALVNGGTLYQPYLAQSISSDGKILSETPATTKRQVLTTAASVQMRTILENVVASGSGRYAQVAGFRVGGKTGTAQKYVNGAIAQGKYVSSFVGFFPAENPKYVAIMLVNEPSGYLYYGSIVAAPYVGEVFTKITVEKRMTPSITVETNIPTRAMPNLIGLEYAEAAAILKSGNIVFEAADEGEYIISQLPAPGEPISKKDVAFVRLGNFKA